MRMTDPSSTSSVPSSPAAVPAAARRRGGSLRRRLPLVISLFLVAIVGAGGTASYLAVRRSVLDAAEGRLQTNARQWTGVLAQGMAQRLEEARRAAAMPVFRRRLATADPATAAAAQDQLSALLKAAPPNLSVELWNAAGQRVAYAMAASSGDGPGFPADTTFEPPTAAGSMPLRVHGTLL
jgi:hypothetical protein